MRPRGTLPCIDGCDGCGGGQSSLSPISPASVTSARLRTSSYSRRSGPSWTWPRSNSPSGVNSGTAVALTTGTPSSIAAATCRASCGAAPPISANRLRAAVRSRLGPLSRSAARTAISARISGFSFSTVASAITSACATAKRAAVAEGRRRADPLDQLVRQRANARVGEGAVAPAGWISPLSSAAIASVEAHDAGRRLGVTKADPRSGPRGWQRDSGLSDLGASLMPAGGRAGRQPLAGPPPSILDLLREIGARQPAPTRPLKAVHDPSKASSAAIKVCGQPLRSTCPPRTSAAASAPRRRGGHSDSSAWSQ